MRSCLHHAIKVASLNQKKAVAVLVLMRLEGEEKGHILMWPLKKSRNRHVWVRGLIARRLEMGTFHRIERAGWPQNIPVSTRRFVQLVPTWLGLHDTYNGWPKFKKKKKKKRKRHNRDNPKSPPKKQIFKNLNVLECECEIWLAEHWNLRYTVALNVADGGYTKTFVARNVAEERNPSAATLHNSAMQFSHCAQYCTVYPGLKLCHYKMAIVFT